MTEITVSRKCLFQAMDFLFAVMHYVPMEHKYIKHDTHIPADLQTNSLGFGILLNSARVYRNFWILKQLNKVIFRRQINPSILHGPILFFLEHI